MKTFIFCALAAAGAVVAPPQTSKPANPLGNSPQVAESGRMLYNRTCTGCHGRAFFTGAGKCSGCHMIRGQGGVLGPDLSSIGAQLNLKKLQETLTKERP